MNWNPPEEVVAFLERALKGPLLPGRPSAAASASHAPAGSPNPAAQPAARGSGDPRGAVEQAPVLDRAGVEALLPYRHPYLFVDRVAWVDLEAGLIRTQFDLSGASDLLSGHFPNYPVWPGALQIEAIAQAGTLLYVMQTQAKAVDSVALTHVFGARFLRPVLPGADFEVVAQVLEDGMLVVVLGQCLQNGKVCSVAALAGI